MSESDSRAEGSGKGKADQGDELKTIGFRLREIQRLLAARVEQENRRLKAEGLDPVSESRFVAEDQRQD